MKKIDFMLIFLFSVPIGLAVSADNSAATSLPQLVAQPSKWIDFKDLSIAATPETVTFDGKFIVLGKGIYGHFDITAHDDSGSVLYHTKSDDRPYQRDHSSRIKSISLSIPGDSALSRIEISFHEMRIEPQVGACISQKKE